MAEEIILTKEGLRKLDEEYRHLIDVERPDVIEALTAARAQGDLSENADYDAARDRQARIEARITEIEHIRDIAKVVDSEVKSSKKINLGNVVTYKELEGDTNTVKIVGTVEADPMADLPLISIECALGKALINHTVGDIVVVEAAEPYSIEILKVELDK